MSGHPDDKAWPFNWKDELAKEELEALKRQHNGEVTGLRLVADDWRRRCEEAQAERTKLHDEHVKALNELTRSWKDAAEARDFIGWMAQTVHQAHHAEGATVDCEREVCAAARRLLGITTGDDS